MSKFCEKRGNFSSTDSGIGRSELKSVSVDEDQEKDLRVDEKMSEKEILLNTVKRQVKLLMEEFVSRKFVHEYSSNVMSICATIEACLLLGLKRRALGLFKESSSLALLEKISKQNQSAKLICNKMVEERKLGIAISTGTGINGFYGNNGTMSGNHGNRETMGSRESLQSRCSDYSTTAMASGSISHQPHNLEGSISSTGSASLFGHSWSTSSILGFSLSSKTESTENECNSLHARNLKKHYWIRLALTEKVLDKIIDYLVKNSTRYYGKDSIIGDPCDGYILVSLMCGPCSLEYSRIRNPADFIAEDPAANQLIQKQKIHSQFGMEAGKSPKLGHAMSTSALFWNSGSVQNLTRPSFGSRQLKLQSSLGISNSELTSNTMTTSCIGSMSPRMTGSTYCNNSGSPRNYIESLHQTNGSNTLLFGKNNVLSQPREDLPRLPGYLSLHMTVNELIMKWTPNALMSGGLSLAEQSQEKLEWNCAMIIWISKIVSIHCHRQEGKHDVLIMVNHDGSQNPPFEFPTGGHLVTFLTCLETGLQPKYRIDPPIFTKVQKDDNSKILKSPIDKNGTIPPPQSADNIFKRKSIFMWSSTSSDNNSESSLPTRNINRFFYNRLSWFNGSNAGKIGDKIILSEEVSESEDKDESAEEWKTDMIFRIVKCYNRNRNNSESRESCSDFTVSDDEEDNIFINIERDPILPDTSSQLLKTKPSIIQQQQTLPSMPEKGIDNSQTQQSCQSAHNRKKMSNRAYSSGHNEIQYPVSNKSSINILCKSMKKEILARSFYGWLAYCRHMKVIRSSLSQLVYPLQLDYDKTKYSCGLTKDYWSLFHKDVQNKELYKSDILRFIYWGGCDASIRKKVWPYLLGVYDWSNSDKERRLIRHKWARRYDMAISEWMVIETIIDESNNDQLFPEHDEEQDENCIAEIEKDPEKYDSEHNELRKLSISSQENWQLSDKIVITKEALARLKQNLNRIEKDVARCDRHFAYYGQTEKGESNLITLHRIMCAWVWENLSISYIQGMCDLLAPILVVFDGDEEMSYSCFCRLMEKMLVNFPIGDNNQMDLNFSRMRSAVNILDSELLDHMQNNGDFTHFYFSYRWFLLDFKREFSYSDIFNLWEVIWSGQSICSSNFSLFVGLALFLSYRDIIMDNNMEFTDIIRFFNEMAEKHDVQKVMDLSRELVEKLQLLLHS